MSKGTGFYPRVKVDGRGRAVVSHGGSVLLTRTAAAVGLDSALRAALGPWRRPLTRHDPGKVVLDLALSLAMGGDCLADVAALRGEPQVFGAVASDPTISRLVRALADAGPAALAAIAAATGAARASAWDLAGADAPDHHTSARRPLILDVDATLVTAHSDKEGAAPTFKRGYGHHPLWAFADHGPGGTGEPLSFLLRPGNAGSNTATDHIEVIRSALAQLPGYDRGRRPGKGVLVRIDGAGGTHALLDWLTARRLGYSVGFTLPGNLAANQAMIASLPEHVWTPAYDSAGGIRDGADVAEVTGLLDLSGWPVGMRVILRRERPHPGAQLRITDVDGNRITAFATNTAPGGRGTQISDLELRHRRRARCEDRIRGAKDNGLANLPLHDLAQNAVRRLGLLLRAQSSRWPRTCWRARRC